MKKLVVLGGGISGYGSAILGREKGWEVFLSDSGTLTDPPAEIEYEQGGHTLSKVLAADLIVKSPGIPETAAVVAAAREKGIPVVSEIEFAGRYMGAARTICVTGSNGKTTTTTLIYEILKKAGYDVALGGNIGESFALRVAERPAAWYALELSSFQLDGMYDFRADIGVLMNITPDHLDRYEHCFQNYVDSKMRILQNQGPDDTFVYWSGDEVVAAELAKRSPRMRLRPFNSDGPMPAGLSADRLQIKGLHNRLNASAAALAALAAGVSAEQIQAAVYAFAGVEHRLEPVAEKHGVLYINDSKATNVDSTWYALESMKRPTVWIAGGTDKGNDYEPLLRFAREKVHTLVCMGVNNQKLVDFFGGVIPRVVSTGSLDEAMTAARAAAREGDAVLLSPACASFDLFKNYEHRGRMFKEWVHENG